MEEELLTSTQIKELMDAESLIKLLECPICNEVPIGPVWLCLSGHNVCDNCRTQLDACGLCRKPFSGGRNYFMESVVLGSTLSCPYREAGCQEVIKGDELKKHIAECTYGPKLKWVSCRGGHFPDSAVQGGSQNGVRLYVIRAAHAGSVTPGKLFEYCPPGNNPSRSNASLAWGGGERFKDSYDVLVSAPDYVKWIPSGNGALVPSAVRGGTSEDGEPIYIGRVQYGNDLINGKIHPSHGVCYIGVDLERGFRNYEILVTCKSPKLVSEGAQNQNSEHSRSGLYS